MQIITGKAKMKNISVPKGIHPTKNMVKQSIFSILGPGIEGKKCLDLYAGSGALGIEALSRGAKKCMFVDNKKSRVRVIEENLAKTSFEDKGKVYLADSLKFLAKLEKKLDVVFADPPYHVTRRTHLLKLTAKVLSKDGIFVLEHSDKEPPRETETLKLLEQRTYGNSGVTFFGLSKIEE